MDKKKASPTDTPNTTTTKTSKAKAPAKGGAAAAKAETAKPAKPLKAAGEKPATNKPAAKSSGKTRSVGVNGSAAPSHDQIAQRAMEIWIAKGRPQGQDDDNWAEAVRALTSNRLSDTSA